MPRPEPPTGGFESADCLAQPRITAHCDSQATSTAHPVNPGCPSPRQRLTRGTKVKMRGMGSPSRGATRPDYAGTWSPLITEGAGKAGCPSHPQPPVQQKSTGVEATGSPEHPAFPAQWF